jgi:hypothetical protein
MHKNISCGYVQYNKDLKGYYLQECEIEAHIAEYHQQAKYENLSLSEILQQKFLPFVFANLLVQNHNDEEAAKDAVTEIYDTYMKRARLKYPNVL